VAAEREHAEGVPHICAVGGELNQVWTNIVDNAVDGMNGQGKLRVKTSHDDGYVLVEISDNLGILREAKNRIFEPFFTTKGVGEVIRLGLDIVRRIIAGQGGEIRVGHAPGKTSFRVRLPVEGPRKGRVPPTAEPAATEVDVWI
jgi:signal transduction histidine kinase